MKTLTKVFQPLMLAAALGSLVLLVPVDASADRIKLKGDCLVTTGIMDVTAKWENRGGRQKFSVELEDGDAWQTLGLFINPTPSSDPVDYITLDGDGFFDLNYDTDEDGVNTFPTTGFPSTLAADSTVVLRDQNDVSLVVTCVLVED